MDLTMYFAIGMFLGFVVFWIPALWFWAWYYRRSLKRGR